MLDNMCLYIYKYFFVSCIYIYMIYFETFLTTHSAWLMTSWISERLLQIVEPVVWYLAKPQSIACKGLFGREMKRGDWHFGNPKKGWIKGVQNTFHCMSDLQLSSSKFYIIVSCGGITIASPFWSWKLQTGLKVWNHQNTMMFPTANLYPSFNHHGSAKWVPAVVVTFQLLSCSTSSVAERVILYLMSLATKGIYYFTHLDFPEI